MTVAGSVKGSVQKHFQGGLSCVSNIAEIGFADQINLFEVVNQES